MISALWKLQLSLQTWNSNLEPNLKVSKWTIWTFTAILSMVTLAVTNFWNSLKLRLQVINFQKVPFVHPESFTNDLNESPALIWTKLMTTSAWKETHKGSKTPWIKSLAADPFFPYENSSNVMNVKHLYPVAKKPDFKNWTYWVPFHVVVIFGLRLGILSLPKTSLFIQIHSS